DARGDGQVRGGRPAAGRRLRRAAGPHTGGVRRGSGAHFPGRLGAGPGSSKRPRAYGDRAGVSASDRIRALSADASNRARRRAVGVLYALSGALLLLGLLFGRYDPRRRNRIPLPVRMLSSALVLACALLLWRGAAPRSRRAAGLVAAGMGCG